MQVEPDKSGPEGQLRSFMLSNDDLIDELESDIRQGQEPRRDQAEQVQLLWRLIGRSIRDYLGNILDPAEQAAAWADLDGDDGDGDDSDDDGADVKDANASPALETNWAPTAESDKRLSPCQLERTELELELAKSANCAQLGDCEAGGKCVVEMIERAEGAELAGKPSQIEPRARCRCPVGRGGLKCQKGECLCCCATAGLKSSSTRSRSRSRSC